LKPCPGPPPPPGCPPPPPCPPLPLVPSTAKKRRPPYPIAESMPRLPLSRSTEPGRRRRVGAAPDDEASAVAATNGPAAEVRAPTPLTACARVASEYERRGTCSPRTERPMIEGAVGAAVAVPVAAVAEAEADAEASRKAGACAEFTRLTSTAEAVAARAPVSVEYARDAPCSALTAIVGATLPMAVVCRLRAG
jgi:hypothetical protein